MRFWTLWERQLVLLGDANGVPRCAMAEAFSTTEAAIHGLIWRSRGGMTQINVLVDADMLARIKRAGGGEPRATTVRDLLEWGLGSMGL